MAYTAMLFFINKRKYIKEMKFDLIVGNPPYDGKGKPLYLQILAALIFKSL